ncbi:MAG: CehA/McbA family metallohydrolase [Candidatus Hydrogenedentes bacterium]|nr:CehA/McbA family metallohydrolase [Candidatus Hydrogenedentota bacterium]
MDAYPNPRARRTIAPEIAAYIRDKLGSTVVYGAKEIVDLGDAVVGGERVAGFMETSDLREWYFPLSARRAFSWKTAPVPANAADRVSFLMPIGFGNGSPLPQPSGNWDLYCNDRFAVSIRVVKHAQLWRGVETSFAFSAHRIESAPPGGSLCLSSVLINESFAAFGPALLTVPSSWIVPGSQAVLRLEARADAPSTRWFQLAAAPGILEHSDVYRAVDVASGARPKVGEYFVFFGDIHTHSGQQGDASENKGCGWGSREDNYRYARGPGALDFYALTEHECQIEKNKVGEYLALADAHDEPGRFACMPAFEFTSLLYGHRNIYFRETGGTVVNSARDWGFPNKEPEKAVHPDELWAALERTNVPFFSVPHHSSSASHPFHWDFCHAKHDRLVETYSSWGSSEYYGDFPRGISDRYRTLTVRDALNLGNRLGLIASSDGHDGHPGDAQSPYVKHHHIFHHLGSGRAVVLARELTRQAVWDALHARRCYATTGAPITLSFTLEGAIMGTEIPALPSGRPVLQVACAGSNGLDHVRIIKNGKVVHTSFCHGEWDWQLHYEDYRYSPREPAYYYVRVVQVDGESAWSSPIWVG